MAKITISTSVGRGLKNFLGNLNFKNTMTQTIKAVKGEADLNFRQQGGIYGRWKPLAASTRKDRKSEGFPPARPILVRTGKLRKGFVTKSSSNDAEMTNKVPYMKTHQQGDRKRNVPQRQIMGISDKVTKAAGLLAAEDITRQLRRAL